MQDLTLVGLSEDRTKLVLVSDTGEEFSLPADARLRAALRGDHARLGKVEKQMDSALRPRDIQARIRAGESPESVADAAHSTVDRIMTFAGPVLAERAHIAERAQSASVRRKGGEGPARILGDAVAEQLRLRHVDPESVEWDAWRREDGRWTLVADYEAAGQPQHAEFVFDTPGRYVVAEDEGARRLLGEEPARPAPSTPGPQRRLAPVSTEEELPLGADTIDMVSGVSRLHAQPDEQTVDLTQTAWTIRDRHPSEPVDPTRPTGDADWMATQASERPGAVSRRDARTDSAPAARDDHPPRDEQAPEPASPPERRAEAVGQTGPADDEQADEASAPTKKPARRKGRASVPSWDEIMFGGGRSE
jgi:hypothetical protein